MKYLDGEDIKRELIKMLHILDEFLLKHGISYSVTGGTLIGTIRHNGFIPWDDDIDLMVSRTDYNKIRLLRDDIKKIGNYDIYCVEDDTSEFPFIKFINKDIFVEQVNISSVAGDYLWIDIFPLDKISVNKKRSAKLYKRMHFVRLLLESAMISKKGHSLNDNSTRIKRKFSFFTRIIGAKRFGRIISKNSQKFNDSKSELLGGVVWGYGERETFNAQIMSHIERKIFGNIYINCIADYDIYLKNIYGNYMELPPENERRSHQLKAWMEEQK